MSSYTGLIYIFSSVVFAIGAYMFYKSWRKEQNFVSKVFAFLFVFLALAFFVDGSIWEIISLKAPKLLYLTLVDGFITFSVPIGIIGYLASYLVVKKIPPMAGFAIMFLLSLLFGTMNLLYSYRFLSESEVLAGRGLCHIIGALSSFVFMIPTFLVAIFFLRQARIIPDRIAKMRSVVFGLAFMIVVAAAGFDVIFSDFSKINSFVTNIGLISVSAMIISILVLIPNMARVPRGHKTTPK